MFLELSCRSRLANLSYVLEKKTYGSLGRMIEYNSILAENLYLQLLVGFIIV